MKYSIIIDKEPIVFNFQRNWAKKCKPHLCDEDVLYALDSGMKHIEEVRIMICEEEGYSTDLVPRWNEVESPCEMGYLFEGMKKPKPDSVNWYRPYGFCWGIAPFCREIGKLLYPDLDWRIIRNDDHTVAVGFKVHKPYMIFDILNFDRMSAKEILDFAGYTGSRPDSFYNHLFWEPICFADTNECGCTYPPAG